MSRLAGPGGITASGFDVWLRRVQGDRRRAIRPHEEGRVRQGEAAPKGAWTGNPLGGVKAPEALMLPDPATTFARSAARLETLSDGHPMMEWLRFMGQLARAQDVAARTLGPLAGADQTAVDQAVEARMPPLAADGHR